MFVGFLSYTLIQDLRNFGGGNYFAKIGGFWLRLTSESIYDYGLDPTLMSQAAALSITDPVGFVNFKPSMIHYTDDLGLRAQIYATYHLDSTTPPDGSGSGGGGGTGNPPPNGSGGNGSGGNFNDTTIPPKSIYDTLLEYKVPIMIGIGAILVLGFLRQ